MTRDLRSGRRRGVGRLNLALIVVVLALGALVGADRLAHAYAEHEVASRLQDELGTSSAPDVSIAGFPFLNQVVAQSFHRVTVETGAVPARDAGDLPLDALHVTLSDVRTSNRFRTAVASRLEGTADVGYAALGARTGTGITLGYGGVAPTGGGRVKAGTSTSYAGIDLAVNATGGLAVDRAAQTVTLTDPTLNVVGLTLPASLTQSLGTRFLQPIPVGPLPLGVQLTDAEPTPAGVLASITGTDVDLTG